ncbi:hypothetical protein LshimejAT787_1201940 [Lyophyllum shimeji]|uniref:Uncharacterized protein n=1 Tax=Lyophyllum shimeji TaxID=47721 RepID=A0A9P3USQ2_LYOSH|nr:hypothetical protein LshimejAT787_1201940 [Lyophyllum shimeji]
MSNMLANSRFAVVDIPPLAELDRNAAAVPRSAQSQLLWVVLSPIFNGGSADRKLSDKLTRRGPTELTLGLCSSLQSRAQALHTAVTETSSLVSVVADVTFPDGYEAGFTTIFTVLARQDEEREQWLYPIVQGLELIGHLLFIVKQLLDAEDDVQQI